MRSHRGVVGALAIGALLAGAERDAFAEKTTEARPPTPETTSWYGWQTLLTDGAGIGLLVAGFAARDAGSQHSGYRPFGEALIVAGLVDLLLGAPLIHGAAHQRTGAALRSVGLRAALPLFAAVVGLGIGSSACGRGPDDSEACPAGAAIIGAMIGAATAVATDALFLAREPQAAFGAAHSGLVPTVTLAGERLSVGIGGRF